MDESSMRYLHSLKLSPHNILINYNGRHSNFILADTTLTEWPKLTPPIIGYIDITCLHIWCTQNITSILWYSCQKWIYHEEVANNQNLIMRKYQINHLAVLQNNVLYFPNMSKSWDKDKETFRLKKTKGNWL